jgi:biopolymer transport protein ExbD
MAMNLGPGSGADSDEPIMDINTTPLIDVLLVLLVMLIITIPIQLHAVNIDMPVGKPPPVTTPPEVVKIDIDAQDHLYWQGVVLADRAELEVRLTQAAAQPVQPEIHIRPDRQSRYNTFAEVMVSARRLGLTKLGVIGSEQYLDR